MHFFATSALFLAAAGVLAYLPGKLFLESLKLRLRPLEDLCVASSLGLIISALAYWLMAYSGQERFYVIWPIAVATVFLFAHRGGIGTLPSVWRTILFPYETKSSSAQDGSRLCLLVVIALGLAVLAVLPVYYRNLTLRSDGTMRVTGVYDVFFHIAIANELTHSVPPQAPLFAGQPLNYHYGMDLVTAMFAQATGLSIPDLTLRFVATFFLTLSMLNVYCFARVWLHSGYWACLAVFLVFFGEDFSFIPGLIFHEHADWSVRFFNVPSVLSLFYVNAMLPSLGLLFSGLLCLHHYLQKESRAWLFPAALCFAALTEVKLFSALQIMFCLGVGAIVYWIVFKATDLFKIAALTAALTVPLTLGLVLHNTSGAHFVMSFTPWPYVSMAMKTLTIESWSDNVAAFTFIALPIYLIGVLGLRIIGVPTVLRAIFLPNRERGLRFILGLFVLVGAVITLTCRIVPADATHPYNNSVWFLAQSKYAAWFFAVEVLQALHRRLPSSAMSPTLSGLLLALFAVAMSVPSAVQHFAILRNPYLVYGKAIMMATDTYSRDVLAGMNYLKNNAKPGSVVLTDENLIGPVLALTKCRVPLGYFAPYLVSLSDLERREKEEKEFWDDWERGKVRPDLINDAKVDYLVVGRPNSDSARSFPGLSKIFSNQECEIFRITR